MKHAGRRKAAVFACLAVVAASCAGSNRSQTAKSDLPSSSTTTTAAGTGIEAPTSTVVGSTSIASPSKTPASTASGGNHVGSSTATKGAEPRGTTTTTATTGATTTVPSGLPPEKCPEAKTCRRYAFKGEPARWPTGPNGRATVRYKVYVSQSQSQLSMDQITQAIAAAFATWQRAAPTLQFVYDGIASQPPLDNDGINTVGLSPTTYIRTGTATDNGRVTESDIYLGVGPYVWHPCEQRDNSCTALDNDREGHDLQAITTHEVGHLLWLGDMPDATLDHELTMHPGTGDQATKTSRFWNTLALGDVLAIRSLYPCSCALPPIYSP